MDLGAFHLMSSSTASSIANELMGYWLLLTEGRYHPLRMMIMIILMMTMMMVMMTMMMMMMMSLTVDINLPLLLIHVPVVY